MSPDEPEPITEARPILGRMDDADAGDVLETLRDARAQLAALMEDLQRS